MCGQGAEEPAVVADEPAAIVEEPVLPEVDPTVVVEKSIKELFNESYTKDLIPDDTLEPLNRGQTPSRQLSQAEC